MMLLLPNSSTPCALVVVGLNRQFHNFTIFHQWSAGTLAAYAMPIWWLCCISVLCCHDRMSVWRVNAWDKLLERLELPEMEMEIAANPRRAAKWSKTKLAETVRSESSSCELSMTVTRSHSRHLHCCRHSSEDLASDLLWVVALWCNSHLSWWDDCLMTRPEKKYTLQCILMLECRWSGTIWFHSRDKDEHIWLIFGMECTRNVSRVGKKINSLKYRDF